MHKRGYTGRPAVSSVNCHTFNKSKYVDYHLQQTIKEIPLYVIDLKDFIQKVNQIKELPEDSFLFTLDVKSLYANFPDNEEIKAVKEAYHKHPHKTVSTKV